MTEREKQLIEAYLPSPRDTSLDWDEYYCEGMDGRVYKVHIVELCPCGNEMHYSVYTDGGKRIKDCTKDSNFPMAHLYDNKQDCRDRVHSLYDGWESLRELQQREATQ